MADTEQPFDFAKFAGYSIPNTTQIPDEFLDQHMAFLSGAEVKVMLYIFRRTLGFKRYEDNISLNQLLNGIVRRDGTRLDYGTGLSRSTLVNAIRGLVEKNLVTVELRQSDDRGNEPTTYHLNFATLPSTKIELGVSENHTPPSSKIEPGLVRKSVLAPSSKIEPTINSSTTDSKTINSINNNNSAATASPVVVALSDQGIALKVAQQLAAAHPEAYIREKITYLEFLEAERPDEVKKPAAWLRKAIENDFGAPDGYVSEEDLQRREEEETRQQRERAAADDRATKRQQALQQERERKYAEALAKLHAQYGTTTEDVERWEELLQDVQWSAADSVYPLVADSHLLNRQEGTMVVGIPSQVNLARLSHRGLQTQLKRSIKRVFEQDVTLQLVLIERLG